jgi:membrane protein DedA with SNARE-associated domain
MDGEVLFGRTGDLGERQGPTMNLSEYIVLFVFVAIMGAGVPGLGDAALIGAGTLAGEGKLNVWAVLATAIVAWMIGSLGGYEIGLVKGRWLLDILAGSRNHAGSCWPRVIVFSAGITLWPQ